MIITDGLLAGLNAFAQQFEAQVANAGPPGSEHAVHFCLALGLQAAYDLPPGSIVFERRAGTQRIDLWIAPIDLVIEVKYRRPIPSGRNLPATQIFGGLLADFNKIHVGQLLNSAVVLFGRADRLMPDYPQCLLRLARFRGRDKTEFIDNRQEVGHAFELLQRAQRFLRDHLPVAGRIVPNLFERIDDPLYPPAALREALANALCHRDYSIGGGSISIAIYDDRLEISSTGTLPFDLTPEDLLRPHQSRPWNPLIAQAFYRRGIIESWGRGTLKIVELAVQAGLDPPEFECRGGEMLVRFHPTRYVPPTRAGHELSALQRALLEVLAQIGPASLKQVRASLPTPAPERTVQDNLQLLRSLGLVELTGQRRTARWVLKGVGPWPAGGSPPDVSNDVSNVSNDVL